MGGILAGQLGKGSVSDLFLVIARRELDGVLLLGQGSTVNTVFFEAGIPVFANSSEEAADSSRISSDEPAADQSASHPSQSVSKSHRSRATSTSKRKVESQAALDMAARIILSAFEWEKGEYMFDPDSQTARPTELKLGWTAVDCIVQGMRQASRVESILNQRVPADGFVTKASNQMIALSSEAKLNSVEGYVFSAASSGPLSDDFSKLAIEEIGTLTGLPEDEVRRALCVLTSIGLLECIESDSTDQRSEELSETEDRPREVVEQPAVVTPARIESKVFIASAAELAAETDAEASTAPVRATPAAQQARDIVEVTDTPDVDPTPFSLDDQEGLVAVMAEAYAEWAGVSDETLAEKPMGDGHERQTEATAEEIVVYLQAVADLPKIEVELGAMRAESPDDSFAPPSKMTESIGTPEQRLEGGADHTQQGTIAATTSNSRLDARPAVNLADFPEERWVSSQEEEWNPRSWDGAGDHDRRSDREIHSPPDSILAVQEERVPAKVAAEVQAVRAERAAREKSALAREAARAAAGARIAEEVRLAAEAAQAAEEARLAAEAAHA
ncbi:MAG: DUF4388 domain-containing protein, partial [Blastocatellia bacterium]